jgi:hypothetical protein
MLVGNYSSLNKLPITFRGGGSAATAIQSGNQSNFVQSGRRRNRIMQGDTSTALALYALPNGSYPSLAWFIPQRAGQIGSSNQVVGNGAAGGNLAGGLPADATLSGAGDITNGNLTLIASLIAALTGAGNVAPSPTLLGKLELISNQLTGSGGLTAALTAFASMGASLSGTSTTSLVPYATGSLAAAITGDATLSPNSLAAAVWQRAIEAGFTAEQILRIIAAHSAGAATGLEGANPQFTGLDGTTVRIDGAYSAGTRTIDVLDGS